MGIVKGSMFVNPFSRFSAASSGQRRRPFLRWDATSRKVERPRSTGIGPSNSHYGLPLWSTVTDGNLARGSQVGGERTAGRLRAAREQAERIFHGTVADWG